MAQDVEWDDIHFGAGDNLPVEGVSPDDDIESRTFGSDDGIEGSANKPDDDDLPFVPAANVVKDGDTTPEPDPPVSENMSGIELYLAQFDIEAGIINLEDGTSKHFNELDAAMQADVLQQLHNTQATAVESQYGLDENEVGLLNYLRSNNLSVEEMVESMVNERVATMMTMQQMATEDYAKMDSDALYMKFLKETSPEATTDQLASDLAKAKELSNFEKLTEALRGQYTSRQETTLSTASAKTQQDHADLVESQRQEIVQAVLPITQMAGIELDQNIKNTVLDHILETNDEGDSVFMDEVFSDPESLFKAAFWYVYGEALVQQRDEYWKKEKSAAYKRGKEDALGITPAPIPGRSFTAKTTQTKNEPHASRQAPRNQETDGEDWSDLHT